MCPKHYSASYKGECSINGCYSPAKTAGLCSAHYHRLQRYGDPTYIPIRKMKWQGIICKYLKCRNQAVKKGYCEKHYLRYKRGTTTAPHHFVSDEKITKKFEREYHVYKGMKRRCYNSHEKAYKNYGGRGIKVCDRWLGPYGFRNFLRDMGPRPEGELPSGMPLYSIDRIDVNGNYCPENCRWADWHTQRVNRRDSPPIVSYN